MNGHNNTRADDTDEFDYSEEWLSAYVDDELSTAQRAIVEQRVAVDAEAAVKLRDLQQIRSLVGNLPAWSGELKPTRFDDFQEVLQSPLARATDDNAPLTENGVSLAAPLATSPSASYRGPSPAASAWRPWLRPLAAAACVLLVMGLGWGLWPTADVRSVATSSRWEESEALAAEQALQPQAKSAAAEVESAMNSSVAAAESSAAMTPAMLALGNPAPDLTLQLAYSDAWTPENILAGLGRVSGLLRRPLAAGSELTKSSRADLADTVASSAASAAQDFPVVIATQAQGLEPLVAGLRQLELPLQGPAADARLAEAKSLVPLMEAASGGSSTVALFVSFEQAERVLELARRSELIVGAPAWISSAAMAARPLAARPLAAQQPVVMLFTPQ